MSQILSGEPFDYNVHNRPHNELLEGMKEMNYHHNRDLVHDGDFSIGRAGDFIVNGSMVSLSSTDLWVHDKLVTVNYEGTSGTASGGGFTVTDSLSADDYWVKYDPSVNNLFTAKDSRGDGEIVIVSASQIHASPAVSGDQAVTRSQWSQMIVPPAGVSYEISAASYSISGTSDMLFDLHIDDMVAINTWSAGQNLLQGRRGLAGAGTQNSAINFGGELSGTTYKNTEHHNGYSWSAGGDLIQERVWLAGTGIRNSALSLGGLKIPTTYGNTEKYNGAVWSSTGSLITARSGHSAVGKQNSTITMGGAGNTSERFNGATWVAGGNTIVSRYGASAAGIQNSCILYSGISGADINHPSEIYNGVTNAWYSDATPNITRKYSSGSGVKNSCLLIGGYSYADVTKNSTEQYNGFVWVTSQNIPRSDADMTAMGSGEVSLNTGGYDYSSSTEKWLGVVTMDVSVYNDNTRAKRKGSNKFPVFGDNTFNIAIDLLPTSLSKDLSELNHDDYGDGKWTAGTSLSTGRVELESVGVQNSTIAFGGASSSASPFSVITEKFNGTSWSGGGNLNIGRLWHSGAGCANAALCFGGSSGLYMTSTEKYNGTSWATGSWDLATKRGNPGGVGNQSAALAIAGTSGASVSTTEKFNGSSWSSASTTINNAGEGWAVGTVFSALFVAHTGPSHLTEKFNGSTWVITGSGNTPRRYIGMSGSTNSALSFTGTSATGMLANTEKFNGLNWIISADVNTPRRGLSGSGTQMSAMSIGGSTVGVWDTVVGTTEKFNTQVALPGIVGTLHIT